MDRFNEDFIESYREESNEGYFLESDVQYPEKLHELHNDFPFLPERMEIEKFETLVTNLHDKSEWYSQKNFKASITKTVKQQLKPKIK